MPNGPRVAGSVVPRSLQTLLFSDGKTVAQTRGPTRKRVPGHCCETSSPANFCVGSEDNLTIPLPNSTGHAQRVVWPTPPLNEAKDVGQGDDYTTRAHVEHRRKAFAAWMPQLSGHAVLGDRWSTIPWDSPVQLPSRLAKPRHQGRRAGRIEGTTESRPRTRSQ